jgi:hypothetical protein
MSIRLLSELGFEDHRALLLEVPQYLIEGLDIAPDGTVDTRQLLGLLLMIEQEKAAKATHDIIDSALQESISEDNTISFEEHVALMRAIFDPTCAVDVTYSSPLKQQRK